MVIQGKSVPCYGDANDDRIYERQGNGLKDKIIMKGGDDLVIAHFYGNDTDIIKGGSGYDRIYVNDGDTASGGKGARDVCYVDAKPEAGQGCGRVIVR